MSDIKRRCFGITINLHRCSRVGNWTFFCQEHKKQPIVWFSFLVFTVIAGIASIYSAFFQNYFVNDEYLDTSSDANNYAISFSISNIDENRNSWIDAAYELFKKKNFEIYKWSENDKKTLEIINLSANIPAYIYSKGISRSLLNDYFIKILKDNGLLVENLEVNVKKIDEIPDNYEIILNSGIHDFSENCNWNIDIENLLKKNGYSVLYDDGSCHDPTFLAEYPPWNEVTKIYKLILNSSIELPNSYKIHEHDETESFAKFLQNIERNNGGFTIHAFIPLKWQNGDDLVGSFRIVVTNPSGKVHVCSFTQKIEEEFNKKYPNDFKPLVDKLIDGEYVINAYLDSAKIISQKCIKKSSQFDCTLVGRETPIYQSN